MNRNEFLTRAMGRKWHAFVDLDERNDRRCVCGCFDMKACPDNLNFSTWTGFGKLWEWASEQEWFFDMKFWIGRANTQYAIAHMLINPDRFADEIYAYLKRKEK